MTPSRRRLALAAGGAAALFVVYLLLRAPAVPVDVAQVTRGPLQVTVDEEGETRVRRRFVVAAPTTGRLLRIALDEGDEVTAGAVVARILPSPLDPRDEATARARIAAAEAEQRAADARVAMAEADAKQAERDAGRAERLQAAGASSAEALELARTKHTEAEQQLAATRSAADAANHVVTAARAVLIATDGIRPQALPIGDPCSGSVSCVDIRSPEAGHVLRVLEESERIVLAGTPLIQLGDPGDIEIVVDVLSADAVRVHPGDAISIEDWGGDQPLRAKVRRVEPAGFTKISALGVEEQRVNVIGDFVDPPGNLGDGYRIEARIVVWQADGVVRVPGAALFRRGQTWHVFVADGGRARLLPVDIGHRGTFEAEVRSGLEPGQRVVLHPSDRVEDGVRIALP